jgi:hypothetical protein
MSQNNLTHPVAAAATTQVKLCPYNEEEPRIWFCLIEAQFAAAGIRSQKLKYASALDILDTLDVCNDLDEPLDCLKDALLGQFGKSKWQLYFELLRLPMEIQGFKPSVLMGKLKQHLLLQPLPWKFLATRFRWQEWPPWPITLPKLNSAHPLMISNSCNVSLVW